MKQELTQRIKDRLLQKHIAFGGLARKGEVALKGDIDTVASDLTQLVIDYMEDMSLKQIKIMVKDMFQ